MAKVTPDDAVGKLVVCTGGRAVWRRSDLGTGGDWGKGRWIDSVGLGHLRSGDVIMILGVVLAPRFVFKVLCRHGVGYVNSDLLALDRNE